MKPLRFTLTLVFAALVVLFGRSAYAGLSIVATTPDIAAIARQVGGSAVDVKTLALPTQDPHFVDAKPSLALVLNKADLLLVNGLDLEIGWLPTLQSGARNPKIQVGADGYLDCGTLVPILEAPAGQVSRAQGDVHPQGNPHYLLDPRNGAKVGKGIAARLSKLDPANAAGYAQRAADFEKEANALATKLRDKLGAIDAAKRKVVVYHRSFIYLESWLGLTEVGALEPKPGIPPDPAHVAQIMVLMKSQGVKAILEEEYYPMATGKLLAEKTGAAMLVVAGGTGDSQRYLDRIQDVADKLAGALP